MWLNFCDTEIHYISILITFGCECYIVVNLVVFVLEKHLVIHIQLLKLKLQIAAKLKELSKLFPQIS